MRYKKIGVSGTISIAKEIEQHQDITSLKLVLFMCGIGFDEAQIIKDALIKLEKLTSLTLDISNKFNGLPTTFFGSKTKKEEQVAQHIGSALEKLQNLTHLNLNMQYVGIMDDEVQYITNALGNLQQITNLTLKLMFDNGGQNGVSKIANALGKLQKITSLTLDLSGNELRDYGIAYIANSLEKLQQISYLSLELRGIYQRINQGVIYIANALKKLTNITSLTLNVMQSEYGQYGLIQILNSLSNIQNLTQLTLVGEYFYYEADLETLKSFATLFEKNQKISSLTLWFWGKLPEEVYQKLPCAIQNLSSLKYLSLWTRSSDNIDIFNNEDGVKCLAKTLEKNQNIISLDLQNSFLCLSDNNYAEGCKLVAFSLGKLQKMTQLNLKMSSYGDDINNDDKISSKKAKYFADELEKLQNINSLNLQIKSEDKRIPSASERVKQILSALGKLKNLTSLSLIIDIADLEEVKHIGSALEQLNKISSLSLQFPIPFAYVDDKNSRMGNVGAIYLANGLEKLTNITYLELDLSKNQIEAEGVHNLSNAIQKLQNIIELRFTLQGWDYVSSGEEGGNCIAGTIEKLQKMTHLVLDLEQNDIGRQGIYNIVTAIEKNQNISYLDLVIYLKGKYFSSYEEKLKIYERLRNIKHLEYLKIG
ncbi:hypothetical protein ABPG72_011577 [Tetrahymena utriculariae]